MSIVENDVGYERNQAESKTLRGVVPAPIQISLDNIMYEWNGTSWYEANTFKVPPQVIQNNLNARLYPILEQEDDQITNLHELLERAEQAKEDKQYHRSEKLVRRALASSPNHLGARAILSSCLRATGRAQQALDETEFFKYESYPPLLSSRAAALCDLERWEEAKRVIGRVLAMEGSPEAFLIVQRVKNAKPNLY